MSPAPATIQINNQIVIPHLRSAPRLEDFVTMSLDSPMAKQMAAINGLTQRDPKDGDPVSQATTVLFGYTEKNFYAVFLCHDREPGKIRAHLTRRENIGDDENVLVYLDTFDDRRRAYTFATNPLGVQRDDIFTDNNGHDPSFDTLWNSAGKVTPEGYVVWMEIPFRSIRFNRTAVQKWGLIVERDIPRNSEVAYWPRMSRNVQGLLYQEGQATGMSHVSPGRNIQITPYGVFEAFRALDTRDPNQARFTGAHARPRAGVDTKIVIKDKFVLDLTANPDFSQVESDEPQVTVNQRFEVFFPERRPFFLENGNYFDTPFQLVFTRRIHDPKAGARLTAKLAKWSIGYFGIDDTAPGKEVLPGDPMEHMQAFFNILRVNREFGKQSSIGFIYTDRELPCSRCANSQNSGETNFNRVGGFDYRWKFNSHLSSNGQVIASDTKNLDGTRGWGNAFQGTVQYTDRRISASTSYSDVGAQFVTHSGFFVRPDVRQQSSFFHYSHRREGKLFYSQGINIFENHTWDHHGVGLNSRYNSNLFVDLRGQISAGLFAGTGTETLRPADFSELPANHKFNTNSAGVFLFFGHYKWLVLNADSGFGNETNYGPPVGPPTQARNQFSDVYVTLYPKKNLAVDNRYLLYRDHDPATGLSIFNSHTIRSKWNYQITRELSLRFIGQYDAVLANPLLTTIQNTKNFNADFLITWLLHPGTAVYVGYNSNLNNLDRSLGLDADGNLLRTRNSFINDGRTVFVKVSWQFRY